MSAAWRTRSLEVANWAVLILAFMATFASLWFASHGAWWIALPAALVFALVNNTLFCLLHEAVHGIASPSSWRNDLMGHLTAMAFPTSFQMQRIAHLGHHRRNRSDVELYDYYLPSQRKWLRNVWLYGGNLFGLYWFAIPILGALYLLAPWAWRSRFFVERVAPLIGFGPFVADLAALRVKTVWPEVALAFAYQAAIFVALDLTAGGWLLAHWFFALHWSALQYVDHAWSARDVTDGAWNLKVSTPARWLALNYHYHRAHHQHPDVAWVDLPKYVPPGAYTPSFWAIYRSLWRGVRPAPPMGAPENRRLFETG